MGEALITSDDRFRLILLIVSSREIDKGLPKVRFDYLYANIDKSDNPPSLGRNYIMLERV